jgi:uncharacterized phage protein (TIGR01671 family)
MEIKFRGKTGKGEWLYGYYLEKHLCDGCGRCSYIKFDGSQEVKVIPETVGQFTGLLDSEGTEIYGGDILKQREKGNSRYRDWERILGSVVYEKKSCGSHTYAGWYTICPENGNFSELATHSSYKTEVIGNIHDNPELLKQK